MYISYGSVSIHVNIKKGETIKSLIINGLIHVRSFHMNKLLIRPDLNDDFGILQLQNKILEIMSYIDAFCSTYGIEYCLMGGSALGAKRHNGFIPWDDDLDIFMTPNNYERFREMFFKYGDSATYYLQEWGLTDGMVTTSKVRMNGTSYIEESLKNWDVHQGIYVDIFVLHTCPNNKFLQFRQFFWAKYIILRGLSLRNYTRRSGFIGFVLKAMRLLPSKFLIKHGLKQVYKYRNRTTNYYCNFLGKAVFKKGIYKREWFEHPKYVAFETIQLLVPGKLSEFLSERFGDYMKIPSMTNIKREQHAETWDTTHDFRNILPNIANYGDEKKLI